MNRAPESFKKESWGTEMESQCLHLTEPLLTSFPAIEILYLIVFLEAFAENCSSPLSVANEHFPSLSGTQIIGAIVGLPAESLVANSSSFLSLSTSHESSGSPFRRAVAGRVLPSTPTSVASDLQVSPCWARQRSSFVSVKNSLHPASAPRGRVRSQREIIVSLNDFSVILVLPFPSSMRNFCLVDTTCGRGAS